MSLHRITFKYFLSDSSTPDLSKIIGIFHNWIQQKKIEGLMIDVADYRHVPEGPGVMLIGHDFDYALDLADGRPGLGYTRKRTSGSHLDCDLGDNLRAALRGALIGCQLLEDEPDGSMAFRTDEAVISIPDRLHAANRESTLNELREPITAVLEPLYNPATVRVERDDGDERRPLTLKITAEGGADLNVLLDRLGR